MLFALAKEYIMSLEAHTHNLSRVCGLPLRGKPVLSDKLLERNEFRPKVLLSYPFLLPFWATRETTSSSSPSDRGKERSSPACPRLCCHHRPSKRPLTKAAQESSQCDCLFRVHSGQHTTDSRWIPCAATCTCRVRRDSPSLHNLLAFVPKRKRHVLVPFRRKLQQREGRQHAFTLPVGESLVHGNRIHFEVPRTIRNLSHASRALAARRQFVGEEFVERSSDVHHSVRNRGLKPLP
jgi:hypothetical protein